jgi:hypothetical protein
MKATKRVLITLLIGIILVTAFYIITNTITKYTGFSISEKPLEKDKAFNDCLKENDITLFINSEDVSSTLNNIKEKNYLDSVKEFNCLRNKQICLEKGIISFPTWIINNNKIEKDISVSELSEITKCDLV